MKNLLTFLLFLGIHSGVWAQSEPFRLDSLPKQGVLLDKGWKWHPGDNPDFAKSDFDDSKWEGIEPAKDVMSVPQTSHNGQVGWLRLRIKIDTALTNTVVGAIVNQVGASEIYLDEKLLIKFGNVSSDPNEIQAYNPSSEPKKSNYVYANLGVDSEILIAVRYVLQPGILYHRISDIPNPVFKIQLKRAELLNENKIEYTGYDTTLSDYFRSGLFFILGLLHLLLYIYNRQQKTNLFSSLYYIFGTFFFLIYIILYGYIHSVQIRMNVSIVWYLLVFGLCYTTITIVYSLFQFRKGVIYWAIVLFPIPYFLYFFWQYDYSGIIIRVFPIAMNIDAIRVCTSAILKKKKGAWIMLIGTAGWTLFYIILVMISLFADPSSIKTVILDNIFYNLSFLIFPICVTIILARDFASTSKSLEIKLVEVQNLSKEKQQALQKQNAELQAALLKGQTIERQRVALDLHDNLGSTLSALWLSVETVDQSNMNTEEMAIHQNLRENLEKAYNDVRLLSHNLLPEEFEKQGLVTTLQGFVRKVSKSSGIRFDLKIDKDFGRVDNRIEFELYSICLELVNNILKHSKASEAKIELLNTGEEIKLTISDNGIGTFENDSDGKGMKNVRARVESLNGTWESTSEDGKGTNSIIVVPV